MNITLEKMLEALSHEQLGFMVDGNGSNGAIEPSQIPKVIGRLNSVLRRLAVKFVLSEKTIRVNVTQAQRYYTLNEEDPWIVADPDVSFTGDVGRILGIETPNGRVHPMNDLAKHDSILLRDDGKAFALDKALPIGQYSIIYKAATPQFAVDGSDLDQEIEIPEPLLNALYLGVAAITYEGIGGPENVSLAAAKWKQYEKECGEAKINSAVEEEQYEEVNNFKDRGFC